MTTASRTFSLALIEHKLSSYAYCRKTQVELLPSDKLIVLEEAALRELIKAGKLHEGEEKAITMDIYEPYEPIGNIIRMSNGNLEELCANMNSDYFKTKATHLPSAGVLEKNEIEQNDLIIVFTISTPQRILYPVEERDESGTRFFREDIAKAACKRESPSTGAKLPSLLSKQVEGQADAVYNNRPLDLAPPPITIYHPVFAKFIQLMAVPDENLSSDDLKAAMEFITTSASFYPIERNRKVALRGIVTGVHAYVLQTVKVELDNGSLEPDGYMHSLVGEMKIPFGFTELKNEIGEGGSDPIAQAECAYVAVFSSGNYRRIREASCCPAFLIGIAGPQLAVSGAVFADTFISERLTDYIYLGPVATSENRSQLDSRVRKVAQLFRALRECLGDLDKFYKALTLRSAQKSRPSTRRSGARSAQRVTTAPAPSFIFPHFSEFTINGQDFRLTYMERLARNYTNKAVFKASFVKGNETHTVVVKFTHSYGREGHDLLAGMVPPMAPKLWYCERVSSVGLYVVIMEFVQGRKAEGPLDSKRAQALRNAVATLHGNDLVFGDLRQPNLLATDEGIALIDFDWCGRVGEARYPSDILIDDEQTIPWHNGVCHGGLIEKEHDRHMYEILTGELL